MAVRQIFIPASKPPYWSETSVSFEWHPGLSTSQKMKSVQSLHESAKIRFPNISLLEVSTKSDIQMGVQLSAFNLYLEQSTLGIVPFEAAFQSSKVYRMHGQITEALRLGPREAKSYARTIDRDDQLLGFQWNERVWPLEPKSWFYDWLYIQALLTSAQHLIGNIREFGGFTDIEFNPLKSFNCQARTCAIVASSHDDSQLSQWIQHPELLLGDPQGLTTQVRLF
ncbi:MAG: hypothetical protein KC435_06520 [Thermomicrobiales bacterium]|nr:hypothetical protein [Thermomicrobiales bacterium]